MDFIENFNADILLFGESLTTEERNKLPDSAFGVPSERKFPLTDKGHVLSALSYFHTYEGKHKAQLAKNIYKAAKKYNVELSSDSDFIKYYKGLSETYAVQELEELSTGGLGYYAPLVGEESIEDDKEIDEIGGGAIIPTAPVQPLKGTTICNTPNEIELRRSTMTEAEIKIFSAFERKLRDVFTFTEAQKKEYTEFYNNFPEKLFEALRGDLDEGGMKDFSMKWNTIIELAREFPKEEKELIFEVMGKNIEDRFDNIIFTENYIPNKYNKLFRLLKEGFTYLDYSDIEVEKIEEQLINEGSFTLNEAAKSKIMQGLDKWEEAIDIAFEDYFKVPIFVILTDGKTAGNKLVTKITKTPYGHSSLSFDLSLDKVYSFGTNRDGKNPNNRFMTFVEESKSFWNNLTNGNLEYHIFAIFIDKKKKDKMWERIKQMIKNKTKFSYNYLGIFGYLLNTPIKVKNSFFCSEFIAALFKTVGIELFDKPDGLVAPHDFALSNKFIKIEEGKIKDYNQKKTERKVKAIMDKYYAGGNENSGHVEGGAHPEKSIMRGLQIREMQEANLLESWFEFDKYALDDGLLMSETFNIAKNTLPIEIDKDGNVVIHKLGAPDYPSIFAESHKLLLSYAKVHDVEGMKYELAKLWTCIRGIESKLYGPKGKDLDKAERKKLIDTRALMINDFKKYLKEVIEIEPDFNFEHYYKDSDYNSNIIRLTRNSVKGIALLIKSLLA